MTLRGTTETPPALRRHIARLMQLHYDLHPERLSARLGLSPQHLRRIWRETPIEEMPSAIHALDTIARHKAPQATESIQFA